MKLWLDCAPDLVTGFTLPTNAPRSYRDSARQTVERRVACCAVWFASLLGSVIRVAHPHGAS